MNSSRFAGISDECPACRSRFLISPGERTTCLACGAPLAACGHCGRLASGDEAAREIDTTAEWLCPEHAADQRWESRMLKELAEAPVKPDSPSAVAIQIAYEDRIRRVYSQGKLPSDELFGMESELTPESREFPEQVVDAYRFYERAVMQEEFGIVAIFLWEIDGSELFVIHCDSDGSDGWLELYDAAGAPLAYAQTEWDCPVWTSKAVVRRRALTGETEEAVERQLPDVVQRLRGK